MVRILVCLGTVNQTPAAKMNFFRHPFVFITFAVIFGILLRIETEWYLSVLLTSLVATLTLALLRKSITKLPAIVLLFFTMGFMLPQKISQNLLKEDQITAVVQITERKSTQKDWDQAIGEITHIRYQGKYERVDQKVLIYTNSEVLRRGMKVLAVFTPKEIWNSGNPGSFNAETYWMAKGIRHVGFVTDEDFRMLSFDDVGFLNRYAEITRSYISDALDELPSDHSGVVKALLLGDKGDLSTEIRDQFANAGAMHLLAVSGLHIGIIAFILLFIFKQFPHVFSNLSAHITVVVLLWAYAFVTGLSPSVTRAVLMFSLLILSRLARGQYEPINVLAFSAFIVILINPLVVYDIGFQLSYLAVLGIFIFYERLAELFSTDYKVINWLWQGTAIGLSAQLATAPLTLYYFHQFPNYFVISNLGIMLLAAVLMFTALLFVITFQLTFLRVILLFTLSFLVSVLIHFIGWVDGLPWSVARGFELNMIQVVLYFTGLILLINLKYHKWFQVSGLIAVFTFILWIQFDRYQNLTSNHLIIANNDLPISFLRVDDRSICITTEPEMRKRDQMIIKDYLKIYPGEIKYVLLTPKTVFSADRRALSVRRDRNGLFFKMGEKSIKLLTGVRSESKENTSIFVIAMPFMQARADHHLSKGAFVLGL